MARSWKAARGSDLDMVPLAEFEESEGALPF